MVRKVEEEKPIPLGQVYELLKQREESGINYVQRVTAQHAENLSRNAAYSEEVLEMLQTEFDLSRLLAVQLVNLNYSKSAIISQMLNKEMYVKFLDNGVEKEIKIMVKQHEHKASSGSDEQDNSVSSINIGASPISCIALVNFGQSSICICPDLTR